MSENKRAGKQSGVQMKMGGLPSGGQPAPKPREGHKPSAGPPLPPGPPASALTPCSSSCSPASHTSFLQRSSFGVKMVCLSTIKTPVSTLCFRKLCGRAGGRVSAERFSALNVVPTTGCYSTSSWVPHFTLTAGLPRHHPTPGRDC